MKDLKSKAVSAFGIECPFIREGDDIASIVVNSVLDSGIGVDDMDVVGITESVVARAQGNYVTVDELAAEVEDVVGVNAPILMLYAPIYSRNRFATILRGFARASVRIVLVMPYIDEVGNVVKNHPFTGLDYMELYKNICKEENCECDIVENLREGKNSFTWWCTQHHNIKFDAYIDCTLHNNGFSTLSLHSWYCFRPVFTLMDFFKDKCEWGLLGSNKMNEEKLKLFPSKGGAQAVCDIVKDKFLKITGKNVVVCVYGDGCFHDPVGNILEWADPTTMPSYTNKELIESTPNELKLKELIDNKTEAEIYKSISENNLQKTSSMGTTPRLRRDLIASL
ncbi:MAG: coenzyme F420-0:L-glutamate ligase [Bacteroidales bacterium]|nr:coenzyme F420-0:L-glutamate ligase [Bacteroidales bacterium]